MVAEHAPHTDGFLPAPEKQILIFQGVGYIITYSPVL